MKVKDSGSNYSFYNGSPKATNLPRSVFDLSHINTTTARLGIRYPVWTQHTLPNEDYKIDVEAVARVVNPPVVPLMSRQRILFHTYWLSYHQLWKNAQLFFDKGRNSRQFTESSSLSIPTISLRSWSRGSLADFLGFNCAVPFDEIAGKTLTVPALKFMAYLRVWRDCYLNQRIYSSWLLSVIEDSSTSSSLKSSYKKVYDFLFPSDDADFRIGSPQWNALLGDDVAVDFILTNLKYADFADDYFTRSQLSPMYINDDDIPSIPISNNGSVQQINFSVKNDRSFDVSNPDINFYSPDSGDSHLRKVWFKNANMAGYVGRFKDVASVVADSGSKTPYLVSQDVANNLENKTSYSTQAFVDALNHSVGADLSSDLIVSGITIDAIRLCESATLILEKMAKTDGSYAQYAKAFFGERPKSAYDFRPTYVGGSYQSVLYSQVLNTTSDNQGKVTGIGVSSGSGNIGRFHSDDYGLFITIMTIVPDTYYCQGLSREDTYEVAEDFYLPERAQLGMQGVLEKEIYNQPDDKEAENNILFGYQNIYDELRYRANEVHGDVADVAASGGSVGASFSPYIQTRYFKSAPSLTPAFLTMEDNINNSWLSAKDEPPFIVQIANKVQAVRPVPYRARPATFGM